MTTRLPSHSPATDTERPSSQFARFLYRPIVFQEPQRIVPPASWIEHIPFAFWIIDALRPDVFVELGTQSGNSYSSFAQAVQTLRLTTTCYAVDTWHGDAQAGFYDESVFREWAAYHEHRFSAFSRLIRSTFAEAAVHFSDGSIDLLHVDGCHTYEALSADLAIWRPKMSRRGVILIHDVNVRERDFGAWRVWEDVRRLSPSFEFLHGHGLGVLAVGNDLPEPVEWLLSHAKASDEDVSAVRQFFARLGSVISARAAADAPSVRAADELRIAAAERQVDELKAQLACEQEEHETMLRHQWRAAATLQDMVREQSERRRDLETEAAVLRERESAVAVQLKESSQRQVQLVSGFHARLTAESGLRRRAEAERDALAGRARRYLALGMLGRKLRSGARKPARYIRRAFATPGALGLVPTGAGGLRRAGLSFLAHPARLREAHVVLRSGLFDEPFYRRRYPDVARSGLSPLAHFILCGGREGRSPHPLFDSAYYLRHNSDVAARGTNPLLHYVSVGAYEGRNPHPLFDVAYYLSASPDVRDAGVEPLNHFLRSGAADGRDPNPFFDTSYYLQQYPDVAASQTNPLVHFVLDGWREGRRPSAAFDTVQYLADYPDIHQIGIDPLSHYIEFGRTEGRRARPFEGTSAQGNVADLIGQAQTTLNVIRRRPSPQQPPTVVCVSHVMPLPPRAGNEYRIYRMLRWLRDQGYRVIPVIAPLPGEEVATEGLRGLADEFSNAVLCGRDGQVEYILGTVPDVLASLDDELTLPISTLLQEGATGSDHEQALLRMDQTFCHDAVITTVLRLHGALGKYILLSEYIWMSRILPLIPANVPKVIDTIDVFSTKREKVLQFGIEDLHVEPHEEAKRLRRADLILAIQEEERRDLERLMPGTRVVTAGVDFDVVEDPGVPSGRRVLYVASDNPMNRKALSDFLRFAWPYVREHVPDAELLLAGNVSRALEVDVSGVRRLGIVADLTPLYRQARVIINPAVAGTGLKIKTLEALGHLRPIVTWPSGTDGFPPRLAAFCVTVHDWYEFSRRVADLLAADEPALFSAAERETIVRLTSAEMAYRSMTDAFESLIKEQRDVEVPASSLRA